MTSATSGPALRGTADGACPVCRSLRVGHYCRKGAAAYFTCRDCRTIFQHPPPAREERLGYAEAEYDEGGLYREYVDAREMKLAHFRERLRRMRPHVTIGRLLDVGCSCGYFLEVAESEGFEARGLEFSRNAVAAAAPAVRPKIALGSLETLAGEDAYHVITAFDVVEHLERPLDFLAHAQRLLRPGGHLVLSTPDAGHWLRPLLGASWPMLQPMQHLTLFSRRALRLALHESGFRDIVLEAAQKVLSYQYLIQQLRGPAPRLYSILGAVTRLLPRGPMRRHRRLSIGEVLAIARRVA